MEQPCVCMTVAAIPPGCVSRPPSFVWLTLATLPRCHARQWPIASNHLVFCPRDSSWARDMRRVSPCAAHHAHQPHRDTSFCLPWLNNRLRSDALCLSHADPQQCTTTQTMLCPFSCSLSPSSPGLLQAAHITPIDSSGAQSIETEYLAICTYIGAKRLNPSYLPRPSHHVSGLAGGQPHTANLASQHIACLR